MSGTRAGGQAAARTNKAKYGDDFYHVQGAKGGKVSHPETRPFALNRKLAREAGAKGGEISRRGKAVESNAVE